MRKVFISYNHEDAEVAARIRSALKSNSIEVTIDTLSMPPGGDIQRFIEDSVRTTDVTLSIVSDRSIESAWVALESVATLWAEKISPVGKIFIPCYLDRGFLDDDYSLKLLPKIESQIDQLDALIRQHRQGHKVEAVHLQSKLSRLDDLRYNLPRILLRLRNSLCLDIGEDKFEQSLARIVEFIGESPDSPIRRFEDAFNIRADLSSKQLDKRFVQLTMLVDKGELDPQRWQRETISSLDDLWEINREYKVLVLLGAPGSGKSTLLRKFEVDFFRDQRRKNDDRLSFFAPLNRYRPASVDDADAPAKFLDSMWEKPYQETGLKLGQLLRKGRMLLLLDAINEMPHSNGEEYEILLEHWRVFAHEQAERGNQIIFSCRSLDYSQTLSRPEMRVPNVELQPLTREKIAEFLQAYLPARSDEVLQTIQVNGTLDFYNNPYFLSLLCELIGHTNELPRGRVSLFTSFVRKTMKREMERRSLPPRLLTKADQLMLSQNRWKTPYQLPDDGPLPGKLSHLAYEMQRNGQRRENKQVSIELVRAVELVGGEPERDIIDAGLAINVLDLDIGSKELIYYHQLLQEYFAGRALAVEPRPELASVEWRAGLVRPSLPETIANLANGDPLPTLGQSGWEETMLAALPMSNNPEDYLRQLSKQNLPLAARCAISPEITVSDTLRQEIRSALIDRTSDDQADLRARIVAGEALGLIGDPRFTLHKGQAGECLLPPMAEIPAGRYPIGDDQSGYDLESPRHHVELETFHIGIFPVTNAEYAMFLNAGGYGDERWWDTPDALRWQREGGAEGQRQAFREDRQRWKTNWTDDEIRSLVAQNRATEEQVEYFLWRRNSSDEEFELQIAEWFPAGEPDRKPRFWDDSLYNNPQQPVVGICWYEARAYCNWLSDLTGRCYRLPTEVELEAAARGLEGRRYSFGDTFDTEKCNTFESHLRRPTPVGVFPNRTPEGVYDLTGNVWCWTSTIFDQSRYSYPYTSLDGREDHAATGVSRLVRGGSWNDSQVYARAAFRYFFHPAYRYLSIGVRVVFGLRPPSLNL